jgi:small conductance mechanosensitive channel
MFEKIFDNTTVLETIDNVSKVVDRSFVVSYIPKIFGAVAIAVIGIFLYKSTSGVLKKALLKGRLTEAFATHIVDNAYKFIIVIGIFVGVLNQFGIDVKTAVTGVGVLGIAIGFAAQDSVSNIIAGFMIFFDKPFLVGDYITIGNHYGRVELITMRSTRIRTQDNKYVVIPNQKIINEVLVDHSTNGDTRIIVKASIAYHEDIERARTVILEHISQMQGVLVKPAPDVVVSSLGDSGVELFVRVWIKNARMEQEIFFRTGEVIKNALQSASIEIPYQHVKVIMEK